ncbi:MAG: phosphoglycolate phosphatase [Gammaproteobacteria bacterium]|nr:phosphoglycolate phosphatase [Gammaproteobacteria bacterium]
MTNTLRTVLFDLDGTLADTAPDLAFALNAVLQEQGRAPLPFETIRPVVSHGGTALIRLGFEIEPGTAAFETLRLRLLDIYRDHLARHTRLFPGIEELLGAIEQRGMNWGVVTNKPAWLTDPLLEQIGLSARAACVVSGDTVAERKPHPAPMLHACHLAGSEAYQCLYVGDAARDIEAGRRAGMKTLVALFGYIGEDEQPASWGADGMIAHPAELLDWITAHD